MCDLRLKTAIANKRNIIWAVIYSIAASLMFFLEIATDRLYDEGNIIWEPEFVGLSLLKSVAIGIPVGIIILIVGELLSGLGRKLQKDENNEAEATDKITSSDSESIRAANRKAVRVWIISFVLFILVRIPVFLAYYPGLFTYDASMQLLQIVTEKYTTHHPLAHTLFIRVCSWIGVKIFNDANVGVVIYSVVQIIILSACMAFACSGVLIILRKLKMKKKAIIGILGSIILCIMFFPYNQYVAVFVTKDSLFSGFILVYVTALILLLTEEREKNSVKPKQLDVMLFLGAFGTGIFRNNAIYALVVPSIVMAIAAIVKRDKKYSRLAAESFLGIIVAVCIMKVLAVSVNAESGDRREMMSVPIQQVARTMIYHGGIGRVDSGDNLITDEERQLVDSFIPNGRYNRYYPYLSDPVKENVDSQVVVDRTRDSIKLYFGLMAKYPTEYVNAFLMLNAGFLSIDDITHSEMNNHLYGYGGMGYLQTRWNNEGYVAQFGIHKDSKWESLHTYMEMWAEENMDMSIPVVKYLFMPGIYFWVMIFMMLRYIRKRYYLMLIPGSLLLMYYVTLLLGPGVQMRYVYPFMLLTPFLFGMTFWGQVFASNKDNKI